jgi:hypothetical protein
LRSSVEQPTACAFGNQPRTSSPSSMEAKAVSMKRVGPGGNSTLKHKPDTRVTVHLQELEHV